MGWVLLFAIGLAAFGGLWLLGVRQGLGTLAGAALLFGGAGYALQQRAGLSGNPVRTAQAVIEVEPGMAIFRTAIFAASKEENSALLAADDRIRRGDTEGAVTVLKDAIRARPQSAALWTGLGSSLAVHDGGQVSPAARFAFARAAELAPGQPGPPFFLGMALVGQGDLPKARTAWQMALAATPADAPYHPDIAERLAMIDQFIAMGQAMEQAQR